MRNVQWRGASVDDTFVRFVETCVQCRGCEPACPSGVPFGRLMEGTRTALAAERRTAPRWLRGGLGALGRHRLVLAGSTLLAVAQRLRLVPKRAALAQLPVRRGPAVTSTGTDVWLYTGCVMDAWMRPTHRATAALITRMGFTFAVPSAEGACCGALHTHAGLAAQARRLAERVIRSMPGDAPVLVNSAGCGAAMKDYGHLVGTPEAHAFAARVRDIHEWLAEHLDRLPPRPPGDGVGPVIVQDPCHLRHVQRTHGAVRAVVGHVADVVELDDEGLCCGAGGAYAALQPGLAGEIRDRKVAAIERAAERSGAKVVVSANPGCMLHLAGAGLVVRHPIDVVAEVLLP
jgi:glycolate oxidase iron-sulfur subunit